MRGRVRTHALAWAALSLLAACSEAPAVAIDAGPAARDSAARLEATKGDVKLERDGHLGPAQLGYLFLGDALETGENAEAKVRFNGGRLVEVGPDARFELGEKDGALVLNLDRGLVLSRVPQGAEADPSLSLSILTPFGLTRVGKSEVSVDVSDGGTQLEVRLGQVEFVGKDGAVTTAGAGEKKTFDGRPRNIELAPVTLWLAASGRVELKKKDGRAFAPVSTKAHVDVGAGDEVRVRDGKAALGPGASLVLSSGADAVLGPAQSGEGGEERSLDLQRGQLAASLGPSGKSSLKLAGLSLQADRGAQLTLQRNKDGYQLEVLAGELRVEREGAQSETVTGGSVARIGKQKTDVTQAPRESLVLPPRQGLKVFHSGLQKVTVAWGGDEGKAFDVDVATDAAFTQRLISGRLTQHFLNVPAPARGNLFWRVRDGEKMVEQGSASFAPEAKSADLDANRNQVLDGADKTTIYFQDRPPAVTFICRTEPKAVHYQLTVYREGDLATPIAEARADGERLALKEGALAEGRYLWSATPLDDHGAPLTGGKMNKLEITYDNAVPNLLIKQPRNGDPFAAQVNVVGVAPVGAALFVNGKPVALDDKARFDARAAPLPGGRMVFRLVRGGSEAYTVRTLRPGK